MNVSLPVEIEVEAEVECGNCGASLTTSVLSRFGDHTISAEPCEDCLEKAREEGREEVEGR